MNIPDRQQAIVMTEAGAPPVAVERPVAEPGRGQVLVKVNASSLNFHDNINLMGLLPGPWPRVPMSDGAGVVAAAGPGVDDLPVGQRVMGAFHPGWLDGPWESLDEALRVMRAGEHVGKIAITIP